MSDEEWQEEIRDSFARSGLIPGLLRVVPLGGLVNINFGTHNCVHMGTELEAEIAAYEPSAISYPVTEQGKLFTLVRLCVVL